MKWFYRIFRALLVTAFVLGLVLPATVYVLLSLPPVQAYICREAEKGLTDYLGVDVKIGNLDFSPFSRVTLGDVSLTDQQNDTIAKIDKLGGGISLGRLIFDGDIVVNYVELIGMDARISRDTPESPLNIQPIIDAVSPKDKTKPPTLFDFKVNTVVIRRSSVSYDVKSEKAAQPGRFDKNHIAVSNLRADISLPRMTNDDFTIDIKQLMMRERSGIDVKRLSGVYHITATALTVKDPVIQIGNSQVVINDIDLRYRSFATMGEDILGARHRLELRDGTCLRLSDLKPFVPAMEGIDETVDITATFEGKLDDIDIQKLDLHNGDGSVRLALDAHLTGLPDVKQLKAKDVDVDAAFNGSSFAGLLSRFTNVTPQAQTLLDAAGDITLKGKGAWDGLSAIFNGNITTSVGSLEADASWERNEGGDRQHISGYVTTDELNLGRLLARDDLGILTFNVKGDVTLSGKRVTAGDVEAVVDRVDFRDYTYGNITAQAGYDGSLCVFNATIDDPNMDIKLDGEAALTDERKHLLANLIADDVNLAALNLATPYPSRRLSTAIEVQGEGTGLNDLVGAVDIDFLRWVDESGRGIDLSNMNLTVDNQSVPHRIELNTGFLDGVMEGEYTMTEIPHQVERILARVLPTLFPGEAAHDDLWDMSNDRFRFDFTFNPDEKFLQMINLNYKFLKGVTLQGGVDGTTGDINVALEAPYVMGKNSLLRNTALNFDVIGEDNSANLYFTTTPHVRKEDITVAIEGSARNDRIDTDISWTYYRPHRYDGTVAFTTELRRNFDDKICGDVTVNPTEFVVNDTVWNVYGGRVEISPGPVIAVDDIRVGRSDQEVCIDGRVSHDPLDELKVMLQNLDLDYVFESLRIDNVKFGGVATGEFTASSLLDGEPHLASDRLEVKSIKYNDALMGDAVIRSSWENERRAVRIIADIDQDNGHKSHIDGRIMPMADSLDFHFHADKANIAFMQPFMAAFCSDIQGLGSGDAHLYGSFKYLDMEGDLYAEDMKLKIDFTNTYYSASGKVSMKPGLIEIKDIPIYDMYGNMGILKGIVTHKYFKEPEFDFNVNVPENMLVYDVQPRSPEDFWYGKVFGFGTAHVFGKPGIVNIKIELTTMPHSTFTFELSDTEIADEYTFITFRDVNADEKRKKAAEMSVEPIEVTEWMEMLHKTTTAGKTDYNMDIGVKVTPQAEVVLVMDPVGGDRIKAYGSGDLRLTYESAGNKLHMYGTYRLDRGTYNFTLQDIIRKNFNILQGSTIEFDGNPYEAQLDIKAEYIVKANLSDLDESFLTDKDIKRTNVPVHALMYIKDDMRSPNIKFDLSIPSLDSDVDRKVKSIISTEDMMNRQIVYLLSLDRFYTPEYMMSTTKGNEFVSVASSTISSQLSNALGQLSDNWKIAPNLRSNKGDFSDVEFDLALSSTLLNNRLLLNGNFGYRDKALNNNSFVGDFDIEYLLNRTGTLRLKAYNRYNDQNYYVRPALTTQGVGVEFRHDFDSFSSIFNSLFHRKKKDEVTAPTDSVGVGGTKD